MAYEEIKLQKGMLVERAVKKTYPEEVSKDKKAFVRKQIEQDVFDLEDSVADNAKMISLLITMIDRIYTALDTTTKDLIPAADKGMIEYTLAKFKSVNTRADVQFAVEGIAMVDKLMDRQANIGTIVQ